MADKVRIIQIFQNMDMRRGEMALGRWIDENTAYKKKDMQLGDVFIFRNRKRNIVKVMGARGILAERLPGKQTWDFTLRREQLLNLIGQSFAISWKLSKQAGEALGRMKKDDEQRTKKPAG